MSKATRTLELAVPPDAALAVCRRAAASIDWELVDEPPGGLTAGQDPARLCCRSAPVTVEVALATTTARTTEVSLHGRVPGIGPIASRDLRAGLGLLANAIARAAAPRE